jgi:sugar phosphate isomerase/epimerase
MKIGVYTAMFQDLSLVELAPYIAGLGYEMVEIPIYYGSKHLDIEDVLHGNTHQIKEVLNRSNLTISALNNAKCGQLVLGPLDASTNSWAPTNDPLGKVKFGIESMKNAARAAVELNVPVVTTFVGTSVWDKWYIYPDTNEQLYEEAWEVFAERWGSILQTFKEYGVKLAIEVHPNEMVYNVETAERALKELGAYQEFGFNLDPSHFIWQLIDPVVFIKKFNNRIYHVHAKDGELQKDELSRSGVIPTGSWMRIDRGFRFRVPGWGNVEWRRVISALAQVGYDYVISYEHEDPVMSREDGCEKCIEFLRPLIIKKPLERVWW